MSDDGVGDDPLDGGRHSVLRHWDFVWDYNDDDGPGGFVSGQFLLRSDGVLLRRYGTSRGAPAQGHRWEYRAWQITDPEAGTEVRKVAQRLAGEGYDLMKPSPVGVGERTGPFPGLPALAEKADDLT